MSGDTVEHQMHSTGEGLATLLRQARRSHKLSQEQVALKAGVARGTLNRWEQGERQPRLPELDAVLDALNASPSLRTQALTLINAPRATQALRAERQSLPNGGDSQEAWVFTPETGDLLRTMRLRRDMTQEDVADRMGVRRHSLSRWEIGERFPSRQHLEELLTLLGALPEERQAMTSGVLSPSGLTAETERSFDALLTHLHQVAWLNTNEQTEALKDLEYLRLERAFAELVPSDVKAKRSLIDTYSFHANWLVNNHRYKEAARYADRVLEAAHGNALPSLHWQRSILMSAQCAVHSNSSGQMRPERGIELLQDWLPLVEMPPYKAWILADMANYMAQAGRIPAALDTIAQSCRVAQRSENPLELRLRRLDRAAILLRTGLPQDACLALDLLPSDTAYYGFQPAHRAREWLLLAEALMVVGERSEAGQWLSRAGEIVRDNHLDTTALDTLARRF